MFSVKWFDKVIAQSSRGQFAAFVAALVFLILSGAVVGYCVLDRSDADNAKFGRPATWGLMQCVDGGFVDATISTNTETSEGAITKEAPLPVIFLSLGFWLAGAILMSFFTGAAANFLDARREKIRTGDVDYAFERDYILIVGYDFQVKNLIRWLLKDGDCRRKSVVLVTDTSVEAICDEVLPELPADEERRFFAMRKEIADADSYAKFRILGADRIYLVGDGESSGRDGRILKAQRLIADKAQMELGGLAEPPEGFSPIPLYLHIEDSVLYTQIRSIDLPSDPAEVATGERDERGEPVKRRLRPIFRNEVFNYYESWAWYCWARKRADADYPRLLHIPGTKRAELFVIGAGRMGRAMVNFALPLLNYGFGTKSRITIFDADPLKKGFLPDSAALDAMPEVEVRYSVVDGCSDDANETMLGAAERDDTSVTVVIALKNPDQAIRAYSELSNRLRRHDVSVLVWQATGEAECPDKDYLRMGGRSCKAEQAKVWYFGMTDVLPWIDVDKRSRWGAAVDYYYDTWFGTDPIPESPSVFEDGFVQKSKAEWDESKALGRWQSKERWKKWASVNSADAFYERSAIVSDASTKEATERLLRAEHNRWWTEKLLSGWVLDDGLNVGDGSHQNKQQLRHGDMRVFEDLSDTVKDKDKINIAAMAACGFIG